MNFRYRCLQHLWVCLFMKKVWGQERVITNDWTKFLLGEHENKLFVCMYVQLCMFIWMYTYINTCICAYVLTYMCAQKCEFKHTHTHTQSMHVHTHPSVSMYKYTHFFFHTLILSTHLSISDSLCLYLIIFSPHTYIYDCMYVSIYQAVYQPICQSIYPNRPWSARFNLADAALSSIDLCLCISLAHHDMLGLYCASFSWQNPWSSSTLSLLCQRQEFNQCVEKKASGL